MLSELISRLNELHRPDALKVYKSTHSAAYCEGYDVALELWNDPLYEVELTDPQRRVAYVNALFKVADYFKYSCRRYRIWLYLNTVIPEYTLLYLAVAPLKRAYTLDSGVTLATEAFSYKEMAAYQLGFFLGQRREVS